MKYLILIFLLALSSCASSKQVKGPNGEDAYEVKCGKAVKEKCAEKAADLCPHGYNLLERKPDSYGDQTKVGNAGMLEIKADTTNFMLIHCK
jgi:hypothetical protein